MGIGNGQVLIPRLACGAGFARDLRGALPRLVKARALTSWLISGSTSATQSRGGFRALVTMHSTSRGDADSPEVKSVHFLRRCLNEQSSRICELENRVAMRGAEALRRQSRTLARVRMPAAKLGDLDSRECGRSPCDESDNLGDGNPTARIRRFPFRFSPSMCAVPNSRFPIPHSRLSG